MNFTEKQFAQITEKLGKNFNVRFNKAGNITVEYLPEFEHYDKFWTLYKVANGNCLWRRHIGFGYCYPLHMVNRPRIGPYYEYEYRGKTYRTCARGFNIKECEFNAFEDALDYFIKYLAKYRNIIV